MVLAPRSTVSTYIAVPVPLSNAKFGTIPLDKFPLVDILKYKIYYRYLLNMRVYKPLDLTEYIKKDAERLLNKKFGWEPFLHKHHESRFTRFYEDFWLPKKFGFDKRRAHFSSLILTKQMTRREALNRIENPEMSTEFHKQEFEYIANKLCLTKNELKKIFDGKNMTFNNYKNKKHLIDIGKNTMRFFGLEKRLFR